MKAQDLQHSGDLYLPSDPDIAKAQLAAQELQYDFNQTRPSEGKKRQELLQKMFAEIGEHTYIEPPLHANFGAKFAHFGDYIYANYNLTMVDDTVVGAGSVVTKDLPVNVVAYGSPAKVIREINEHDRQYITTRAERLLRHTLISFTNEPCS